MAPGGDYMVHMGLGESIELWGGSIGMERVAYKVYMAWGERNYGVYMRLRGVIGHLGRGGHLPLDTLVHYLDTWGCLHVQMTGSSCDRGIYRVQRDLIGPGQGITEGSMQVQGI